MALEFTTFYLKDSLALFRYYKGLADRAMAQLPDEQLTAVLDEESNSIAIIVKHMTGNMMSRFTDFFTTDGERVCAEFDNTRASPAFGIDLHACTLTSRSTLARRGP